MGKKIERSVKGVNEALFDMLEKLSDDELQGERLSSMICRSQEVCNVVSKINQTMDTAFKAAKLLSETDPKNANIPGLLMDAVGKTSGGVAVVEKK